MKKGDKKEFKKEKKETIVEQHSNDSMKYQKSSNHQRTKVLQGMIRGKKAQRCLKYINKLKT